MTLCSNSSAGRPTSGFWASRPCKRCRWFPAPILLWSASSGAYGGRIWITYSIGMPGTWNESWSCSGATLMRLARTKVWAGTPQRRKPGVQRRRWPDLRITAGKAIVTVWFTCQLLPDQQFAMYRSELELLIFSDGKRQAHGDEGPVVRQWREGAIVPGYVQSMSRAGLGSRRCKPPS